ncbi:MAG TPA: HDIG domain-containing protein [Chloroflexota bacterium]|nr:HDIG domain-containing protein [Chloroflexota bacterium]
MTEKSRSDAWALVTEYTSSDSLRKHMLAVEAAMRAYARKLGGDEERWGMAGLLHDFDYEQHPNPAGVADPDEHPLFGSRILEEQGYPADVIYAIKTHADYLELPRLSPMDRALAAVDELTGFITAAALVRPDKTINGLEAKSVRKRMKDKAFARNVSREDITRGAEDLGVDLDEHIQFVIAAMQGIAPQLGLDGAAAAATA